MSKRGINLDVEKLEKYLQASNITKKSLDLKIGVSVGYISKCIKRANNMSELVYKVLCNELNVPYNYFIKEEKQTDNTSQLDRIEKKLDELLSYWR
jgi:transcriptional regulator with XRE-family HTH domain